MGCSCLTKESEVYKRKRSILSTHSVVLRLSWSSLAGGLSLVKPSVKPNSIQVERHFIFDARACVPQTNLIVLHTTRAEVCYE